MLRLLEKANDARGLTRTGIYSLLIAEKNGPFIEIDPPVLEFVFTPNPSDIEDTTGFPNVILPDHADGFYVDVNEMGTKTIAIRGTTGQFPKRSLLETITNTVPAIGATDAFSRGGPAGMIARAAGMAQADGYNIWVDLCNFFVRWSELVRHDPYRYSMVFKNTKDAELFQVLPLGFRKTRGAGRPTMYAYAIDLQVIGEKRFDLTRTWMDEINDLRSQIRQWRYALNRSILVASELAQTAVTGVFSTVFNPVVEGISSMTQGLQSLAYTASAIERNAAYSPERVRDVVHEMFQQETYASYRNPQGSGTPAFPRGSVNLLVPPDSESARNVFRPCMSIRELYTGRIGSSRSGTGETTDLNLDDPGLEQYSLALFLEQQGALVADQSPMANDPMRAFAGLSSRDMHAGAREAASSMLTGRENELASATLAADTMMVDDVTLDTGTRHGASQAAGLESLTLSRLAAVVLDDWVQANNERVPPALSAFRDWYLGMRDPDTFAPTYKPITISITDTIYTLAQKYLGNWERWIEIALINDLTYPYFSPQGGLYQRAPGETVYIPLASSKIPVSLIENVKQINKTHDLVGAQDIFLGFDVEVSTLSGDMTYAVYDVGHVAGFNAFMQELSIVLEGSGGVTPDRGAGPIFRIGTKSAGRTTLELWHSMMRQWLISDHRVEKLDWLKVWQDRGAVSFSMSIQFQNYDSAVTLAGELRA